MQTTEAYRRSSTMTMQMDERSSVATKKNLVKARANKTRGSVNSIVIDTKSSQRNIKNLTIDQTSFRRDKESLREFSPNLDPAWDELSRETVRLDNGNSDVILMAKN